MRKDAAKRRSNAPKPQQPEAAMELDNADPAAAGRPQPKRRRRDPAQAEQNADIIQVDEETPTQEADDAEPGPKRVSKGSKTKTGGKKRKEKKERKVRRAKNPKRYAARSSRH